MKRSISDIFRVKQKYVRDNFGLIDLLKHGKMTK